jgi:hypothetical protein
MCNSSEQTYNPFNKTAKVLHLLHPFVEVDLPLFVDDFHLEMKGTLDQETFISALVHSPCLFSDAPWVWCMNFYETILQSSFDLFFKVCGHIARSHVPPLVSHFFFASQLLALEK